MNGLQTNNRRGKANQMTDHSVGASPPSYSANQFAEVDGSLTLRGVRAPLALPDLERCHESQ